MNAQIKKIAGTQNDRRKLTMKQMASLLRSYGMKDKQIAALKRWDRVHVIHDLSTKAASDGMGDELERFHHSDAGAEELDCRKKGEILFRNVDDHDEPPRILTGPMLQSSLPRSNSSDAVSCLLKMSSDVTATSSTTICRTSMTSTSTSVASLSQNESSATSHQYPKSCNDSARVSKATTEQTERFTKRFHEQPGTESLKVKNISDKLLDTYNDSAYVGKWTAEEHAAFLSGLSMYGEDWRKVAGWVKTRSVIQTMAYAENYFQSLPIEAPIDTHKGLWSTIENEAFMTGLELYGKDWVRIAAMIKTRTVVQTTAHAQNYFQQLMKEVNEEPVIACNRKRREQLAHYLIQQQDHPEQNRYQHELLLPQKQVTKDVATKLLSMVPKVANSPKGKYCGTNTNHMAEVDHYSNSLSTARTPPTMLPKVTKATGKNTVKLPKVMRTTGKQCDTDTETERTGRWTEAEHDAFLEGLEMYGKRWNMISRHIKTRTVIQTRTHAQKYFATKHQKDE